MKGGAFGGVHVPGTDGVCLHEEPVGLDELSTESVAVSADFVEGEDHLRSGVAECAGNAGAPGAGGVAIS